MLVVARTTMTPRASSCPALFLVPTDAAGLTTSKLDMEIVSPENQWMLYLDDVRLPADALIGDGDSGLPALFSGLNPERITVAAMSAGTGRYALSRAAAYTAPAVGLGPHDRLATRASRTRWRTRRSRSNWPG